VEDDEALLAIVRRAKEEKKRKRRRLEEEEEAAAASPEGSGGRETDRNFEARKVRGPARPSPNPSLSLACLCNDIACYYSCAFSADFSLYF
jgi:hypothetical protein